MKFDQFLQHYKRKKFILNSMKNMTWKLVQGPFNLQRIFCKKVSEDVCMLIWTTFSNFAIANLISVAYFKNFPINFSDFPMEIVVNSLQIQRGLELVFR